MITLCKLCIVKNASFNLGTIMTIAVCELPVYFKAYLLIEVHLLAEKKILMKKKRKSSLAPSIITTMVFPQARR